MTIASTSAQPSTISVATSAKILAPLAAPALALPSLSTAKVSALVNTATTATTAATKVLETKVATVAAAVNTVVAAKVAEVKELSVPVAQTQTAAVSVTASAAEKLTAAVKNIATPDELHLNTTVTVPVQKVVAAAADVAGKVNVDLSWVSVQTTDSSIKETSQLIVGDKVLAGFKDQGITIPGIDKITSPVAGIDGKAIVNALAGGLNDITVPVNVNHDLNATTPAKNVVISTPDLGLVKTVTASLGDVKVGTPSGEQSVGGSTLGGDLTAKLAAVVPGKTLLAQEIKPIHVNPEPIKVGAVVADVVAKVAVTAAAVTSATLPTLKTPALSGDLPTAGHGQVDKTIEIKGYTLNLPTDKLVAHVDLQSVNSLSGLAYVEGVPKLDKALALNSDVLAVSKLVAHVGLTDIQPGLKISDTKMDLHTDLSGSYHLAPAMEFSPYAGHTNETAGANTHAGGGYEADHSEIIKIVGAGTESPVHYG